MDTKTTDMTPSPATVTPSGRTADTRFPEQQTVPAKKPLLGVPGNPVQAPTRKQLVWNRAHGNVATYEVRDGNNAAARRMRQMERQRAKAIRKQMALDTPVAAPEGVTE